MCMIEIFQGAGITIKAKATNKLTPQFHICIEDAIYFETNNERISICFISTVSFYT